MNFTEGYSFDDDYVDNATGNCTNDYCIPDDEYLSLMTEHIFPTVYEWILIILHVVVFIVGLTGNFLVCLVVNRNPAMRTVTNYFIVNLAVADFLVILICLPPTLLWDTTETWFLGHVLCKLVLYLQTVSVAVSVLTLTFISLDRWYAICFPLKFKSTTSRAKTAILIIWIVSLLYDIPELITLRTASRKKFHVDTVLFTQCTASWDDDSERHYTTSKIIFLYLLPVTITSVAYFQIVRVLWKSDNIPGHRYQREVCFISGKGSSVDSSRRYMAISGGPISAGTQAQLRSRRKAAKMLVCVIIMFALCYLPVHLLSILRYTVDIPQNDITVAIAMLSHWLCYANSATNPLIYNFMSGKYRKEFKKTLSCCYIGRKTDRKCARNELTCRDCRLTSGRTDTAHFGPATTTFDMD